MWPNKRRAASIKAALLFGRAEGSGSARQTRWDRKEKGLMNKPA